MTSSGWAASICWKSDEQLVKAASVDLGRIESVVAIGVVIEQVAQLGRARCGLSADVLRGLAVAEAPSVRAPSSIAISPNKLCCSVTWASPIVKSNHYRVPSRADAFPPPHTDNGITGRHPAVNSSSPA